MTELREYVEIALRMFEEGRFSWQEAIEEVQAALDPGYVRENPYASEAYAERLLRECAEDNGVVI